MNIKDLFTPAQNAEILNAIAAAEMQCSGEIRIHIEKFCSGDPYKRAAKLFVSMGMTATELKNGVLIYLAVNDRKLAIIGDSGINEKVGSDFWDATLEKLRQACSEGKIAEGLAQAVSDCGEQLKTYFPYKGDDKNELNNEISFGA